MTSLDILVPVKNEAENVTELVARIDVALKKAKINYGIIFIDDHSTDGTVKAIKSLSNKYPIKLHTKEGKPGKAFSIIEGAKLSKAKFIAMIDGDLQYPPSVLPQMYKLAQNHGMVVANRKSHKTGILRKMFSKFNKLVFGRLISGVNCDTQSGLKVFAREAIDYLDTTNVDQWSIDIPLLHTALALGHSIGTVDITFDERRNGQSKVRFLKTAKQIAFGAIKQRLKRKSTFYIKPEDGMIGAGIIHKRKRFITHSTLDHRLSALATFTFWQKVFIASIFALLLFGILINLKATSIIFIAVLTVIYFLDVLFSFYMVSRSLKSQIEFSPSSDEIANLKDSELPIYTILCPLYKEAHILASFVDSISKLDWPKEKLDVLLLLEEDDEATINAAKNDNLPSYIRILVVPHSFPKTKPKACNYGLSHATGEFVVIYDAEDVPDPLQLKKAYLGFKNAPSNIGCLQAKLNYYNPHQNLLTRLFTTEYSLWFDLILPGLQSIETTIPLGGTSNHFRTKVLKDLHGWDPFNVTEDCDLGVRLFKLGYKTAIIDSTTLEEANSNLGNWVRQRSRWIKGYVQTYFVHMRAPLSFVKSHGIHAFIFQLVVGGKIAFMLINPILWVATISYFALYSFVGPFIESLFPPVIFYLAAFSLVVGNFLYFYNYMIACAKRGQWGLIKFVFLIPLYWLTISFAASKAIWQLITRPHYWEKTNHGLHLKKEAKEPRRLFPSLYFIEVVKRNIGDFLSAFSKRKNPSPQIPGQLNILIFNWRDTNHVWGGGAESYVHEIAKRWVEMGHAVTLFCGNDGKSARNQTIDGVNIVRRGGFYTVYFWAALYYIFQFRGSFDVIVDSENGIPFFTPLYARIPKVLLIHHIHQEVFRNHLSFPLAQIAMFIEKRLMPLFYRSIPVVTVSASSQKSIGNMGFNTDRTFIVNPGVDIESFKKGKKSINPTFLYLGRLKPYKNVDVAISAFSRVVAKYPKSHFYIAGDGEAKDNLIALVKELNLSKNVSFLGNVSEQKKQKLYSLSWVAVQPSSIEGWGITVIEANASGTPVIASRVSGLRDSVVHKKTGILVKVNDVAALSRAMNLIIENKEQRKVYTQSAYTWSKNFSWDKSSSEFLSVLHTVRNNVETSFAGVGVITE